jgi:hypothetical protein
MACLMVPLGDGQRERMIGLCKRVGKANPSLYVGFGLLILLFRSEVTKTQYNTSVCLLTARIACLRIAC